MEAANPRTPPIRNNASRWIRRKRPAAGSCMIQETALPVEGASPRAAIPIGEGLTFATVAAPAMFPLSTATSKVYRHDDGIGQAPHGSNPSWVVARCPEASPNPHPWKASENRDRRKNLHHPPWSCIWFYAWLCVFYSPAFSLKPQAQPPNIVLILADDLGYGTWVPTIRNRVSPPLISIVCGSRHAIYRRALSLNRLHPHALQQLTGRMAFERGFRGVRWSGRTLLDRIWTFDLAWHAPRPGYRTACYGKWHVGLTFSTHKELRSTRTD